MRLESDIVIDASLACARKGIPVLPVHDELIAPRAKIGDVAELMTKTARDTIGRGIQVRITGSGGETGAGKREEERGRLPYVIPISSKALVSLQNRCIGPNKDLRPKTPRKHRERRVAKKWTRAAVILIMRIGQKFARDAAIATSDAYEDFRCAHGRAPDLNVEGERAECMSAAQRAIDRMGWTSDSEEIRFELLVDLQTYQLAPSGRWPVVEV
jgi:hypothetical protein